jgi:hypothetical protein
VSGPSQLNSGRWKKKKQKREKRTHGSEKRTRLDNAGTRTKQARLRSKHACEASTLVKQAHSYLLLLLRIVRLLLSALLVELLLARDS